MYHILCIISSSISIYLDIFALCSIHKSLCLVVCHYILQTTLLVPGNYQGERKIVINEVYDSPGKKKVKLLTVLVRTTGTVVVEMVDKNGLHFSDEFSLTFRTVYISLMSFHLHSTCITTSCSSGLFFCRCLPCLECLLFCGRMKVRHCLHIQEMPTSLFLGVII
jgi:hypothetical protein